MEAKPLCLREGVGKPLIPRTMVRILRGKIKAKIRKSLLKTNYKYMGKRMGIRRKTHL